MPFARAAFRCSALLVVVCTAAASGQTIWYVDVANCPGPGSGTQASPFCKIQDAISAAAANATPPDEILVANGIYTGTGNKNLDFGGKTIKLRSANGPANCIIDCQASGRGFYFHSGETTAAVLQGLTIRNGTVTSASPGSFYGGGVLCSASSSPTLTNCVITGNTVTGTSSLGGGLYCASSSNPILIDCTISGNAAGCYGGGVYCSASSPTLMTCTISANTAVSGGGGMYCGSASDSVLTDCAITANRATSSASGGGVYCSDSDPILTDCTIRGNTASSSGGGAYCSASNPVFANCTISGNKVSASRAWGGGIDCNLANPLFVNCTINGNKAGGTTSSAGGGLSCYYSDAILTNCTVTGNSAGSSGGIDCDNSYPRFANCILWGDRPPEIGVVSGLPVVAYCDVQGGYTGSGNFNADPGFAFADDLHLVTGSPCIDAGTNTPTCGLPGQDADGNPRSLDGNSDGQAIADIGAYEFDPAAPSIALSPPILEAFAYSGNPTPRTQTLSIRNCGGGVMTWDISEDCPWLSVDPLGGTCQQEIDSITLSLDATALSVGDYSCVLTVSASPAGNSPRYIPVTFHVGAVRRVPSAYATIQAAIDAATAYDWVLVADGLYTGTSNKNLDFHGKAVTVRSESGNATACIIDCQGSGRGFYFHSGETAASFVDGLTIRNGYVTSSSSGSYYGAGVYCSSSSGPTLTNCIISGNAATNGGGMYCSSSSSPTLTNCIISGNTASTGGGLSCSSSSPTLSICTISGNASSGSTGGGAYFSSSSSSLLINCIVNKNSGGGLFCSSSNPTLANCTISGNTTPNSGGGIACVSCSPTMTDCTLAENTASSSGGGVYCQTSSPTFNNCTINKNSASSGGGVRCSSSSGPTLTKCSISGNTASGGGGVYCSSSSSPTLTSCRISGNRTYSGGGLYCTSSSPRLSNCIIDGNSATYSGSGLLVSSSSNPTLTNCTISGNTSAFLCGGVYCSSSSSPTLTNCILWGDAPLEIAALGGTPLVTNSDIQGGWSGTGNIDADPDFAFTDDFHLMSGSPCIDSGSNDPPGGLPAQDADGNPRPLGLAMADMGAYESDPASPTLAVSPMRMEFFVPAGSTAQTSKTLSIRNAGGGSLAWTLGWQRSWLQADIVQGESTGEIDTVTLTAAASTLTHGTYTTTLAVVDPQAGNNPRTVEVLLFVTTTLYVPGEYATIQAAIDAAGPGDEIVVADGTYTGAGNKDLDFHGKALTVRSAGRDPTGCIIDCQGSGRGFYFHSGETAGAVVEGFTIRNGSITTSGSTSTDGGGVYCSRSDPTIVRCIISGNTVSAPSSAGGGMYFSDCRPMLIDCTISGNTADNPTNRAAGGGVYFIASIPTLINCAIRGNSASGASATGGGLCWYWSVPTLVNCTITGNSATGSPGNGGGVYSYSYTATMTNCTISGNTASSNGGGVYYYSYGSFLYTLDLANCILWGDAPQEIYQEGAGDYLTVFYSDIQGGWTGAGNIAAEPFFVDAAGNNYRLLPASPCVDTGNTTALPPDVTTDLDGNPRVRDGNGDGNPVVDMGAYESASMSLGDMDCDGDVDVNDVAAFALALIDADQYHAAHPDCRLDLADFDHDGAGDGLDVQLFVDVLLGG